MNKLSAIATFCGHSDSASEIAPAFRIDQDEGNSHKTNKFELESAHANGGGGLSPLDLGDVAFVVPLPLAWRDLSCS